MIIGIDIAGVIDWFNPLVDHAEKDVNDNWCKINPEEIFECLSRLKVQEWVLLDACAQEIYPAEDSINDRHICDKLPIILLQYCVCAQGIHEACGSWNRVNQLKMERSAPAVVLMLAVDILLLLSKHEPVERHYDKIANDGHGVEQVVSGLQVDGSVRGLEWIFAEVSGVVWGTDTIQQGDSG